MELLELIESVRVEDASREHLFQREGVRAGRRRDARFLESRNALASLIEDVYTGRKPAYRLQEAMSTSDFPLLFADILDKSTLRRYAAWPSTWPAMARRRVVRDFRPVSVKNAMSGLEARLTDVPELTAYEYGALTEATPLTFQVKKYGRKAALSWETFVNDDEDSFASIPDRFALAARRTEDRFAAEMWLDSAGPHASVFTSGNANIINIANGASANNPPLSISGLQDGFTVLAGMRDAEGEPIMVDMVTLTVPPGAEILARNILNATEIRLTSNGGTSTQEMVVANWMRGKVNLVVDPYIPAIVTTGTRGATTWSLTADPNTGRQFADMAFLRGNEQPAIFLKEPNAIRAGGGAVGSFEGDFEIDAIEYKVRHVLGGSIIDPKMSVASNGTGS